jgi:hypothetical protein
MWKLFQYNTVDLTSLKATPSLDKNNSEDENEKKKDKINRK